MLWLHTWNSKVCVADVRFSYFVGNKELKYLNRKKKGEIKFIPFAKQLLNSFTLAFKM